MPAYWNAIYQLVKIKSGKTRKWNLWRISGILQLILSIAIIPLFINISGSPWHSITGFAADIALLTDVIVIFLALNGILKIYISFKQLKEC